MPLKTWGFPLYFLFLQALCEGGWKKAVKDFSMTQQYTELMQFPGGDGGELGWLGDLG